MKISKIHLLVILAAGTIFNTEIAHAIESDINSTNATEGETQNVQIFPYEKTFTITAYYSPVAGQKKYIKGSLEADKRLNGNGTNGADGTPVFPGMIAAPKSIPFGTKMDIPGIGIVSVHDRGGAIVPAGKRGHQYDRLDIWMGSGDEGLNRALNWGKRTVTVMVYGVDSSVEENVDLNSIYTPASVTNSTNTDTTTTPVTKIQYESYGYGDSAPEIKEIKTRLQEIGLFSGDINEKFDENLYQAVLQFQIQKKIVDGSNDFGAGYFGTQTRKTLAQATPDNTFTSNNIVKTANAEDSRDSYSEKVSYAGNGLTFLETDLKVGDSGQAVIELQTELRKLHLFGLEPTGYYGEVTAHAVFKFQQSQSLVNNKESEGAGIFGPITRATLSNLVDSRIETRQIIAANPKKQNLLAKK